MKRLLVLLCVGFGCLFAAVNINTANIEELKSLKGVGEGKARAIIDYRKDQNFTTIDDIKKVKGIGDKIFNDIKDDIVVQ
ncbi:ComEA family DNA-binding protein [Campylobacter troglodytis]|uniref:ComEA family DNA-binding protein n=1 Tax=Campylobacter troglodytis TaxID=654363 RepID=UPI0011586F19|nr:ComEA family DNA-binding protein [Campylobacter troglodytis]TQR53555.1 DNA-binding protein [Campylobacter troglodytis]